MLCGTGQQPEKLTRQELTESKLADNQVWPTLFLVLLGQSVMSCTKGTQVTTDTVDRGHRLQTFKSISKPGCIPPPKPF